MSGFWVNERTLSQWTDFFDFFLFFPLFQPFPPANQLLNIESMILVGTVLWIHTPECLHGCLLPFLFFSPHLLLHFLLPPICPSISGLALLFFGSSVCCVYLCITCFFCFCFAPPDQLGRPLLGQISSQKVDFFIKFPAMVLYAHWYFHFPIFSISPFSQIVFFFLVFLLGFPFPPINSHRNSQGRAVSHTHERPNKSHWQPFPDTGFGADERHAHACTCTQTHRLGWVSD